MRANPEPIATLSRSWRTNFHVRTCKKMKALFRQLKLELANARDATLLLAIIAGFFAWTITQLLKAIFSSG
jgi:hypothetical protein